MARATPLTITQRSTQHDAASPQWHSLHHRGRQPEDDRVVTLSGQQYAPGDQTRRLYPLAFCRDGGQEYYLVERLTDDEGDRLVPRDLGDTDDLDGRRSLGFLYASATDPWPDDVITELDRLPSDWVEEDRHGNPAVRSEVPKLLPVRLGSPLTAASTVALRMAL